MADAYSETKKSKSPDGERYTQHLYTVPDSILHEFELGKFSDSTIIGGAARAVALRLLFDTIVEIRDLDIVTIDNIAEMPDSYPSDVPFDYESSRNYASIEDYITTRDFTVNEVCLRGNQLYITGQAISDLREGLIVPSDPDFKTEYRGRATARAHFLATRMEMETGDEWRVSIPKAKIEFYPFDVAVCLDKAMTISEELALSYLNSLSRNGIFPSDLYHETGDNLVGDAQAFLENEVYDFRFFRSASMAGRKILELERMDLATSLAEDLEASGQQYTATRKTESAGDPHRSRQSKPRR